MDLPLCVRGLRQGGLKASLAPNSARSNAAATWRAAKLEEFLGKQLLQRTTRKLRVTAAEQTWLE